MSSRERLSILKKIDRWLCCATVAFLSYAASSATLAQRSKDMIREISDPCIVQARKGEYLLYGKITRVEKIVGETPAGTFHLGIDLAWFIEIEIEMIEENPGGIESGERIRLAMSSLLASTLGVFSNIEYDQPRFFFLSLRRVGEASVPVYIRVGREPDDPPKEVAEKPGTFCQA